MLLAQVATKEVSVVLASRDALAHELGYAGAEGLLMPVLTWGPDTVMVYAVDVPERRAD